MLPLVLLDGAHNPAGAKALSEYLRTFGKKFIFILGMQANKDIRKYISILKPLSREFLVVRSSNPGSSSADHVRDLIVSAGGKAVAKRDLREAVSFARSTGSPVCLTGSLYLVGDALRQKIFDR